jgi:hypothetical protein
MNNSIRLVLLSAAMLISSFAHATTVSFYCISGNSTTDCATGVAQLSVDVTDIGGNQVQFDFINSGPAASSITDVYFDDGALLGIASLIDANEGIGGDPGVDFMQGASPGNLPAGNMATPPFVTTAGFLADSNSPVPQSGVNPGEWLGIVFDLQSGFTFADVISDLTDGSLRIGMHVQDFSGGGSESFVNNPVPVPAAVWLFGSGLLGLVGVARRKRSQSPE